MEAAAGRRKKKARPAPEARTEFRGVWREPSGRYRAKIKRSGASLHLGMFDTAREAARCYAAAAVELRGAKAITNFTIEPQPPPTAMAAAAPNDDGEAMDFSGFPEVPADLSFIPYGILQLPVPVPGENLDDLLNDDLPPELELQQADELAVE